MGCVLPHCGAERQCETEFCPVYDIVGSTVNSMPDSTVESTVNSMLDSAVESTIDSALDLAVGFIADSRVDLLRGSTLILQYGIPI